MIYGYARTSTDDQSATAEVARLRAAGADTDFREAASGAKTDRRHFRRTLAPSGPGEVLMVAHGDRDESVCEVACSYKFSHSTISRLCAEHQEMAASK